MKSNKDRMFTIKPLAYALMLTSPSFYATSVMAEQGAQDVDNMVVVASRAPKAISDIPGTVWFVESEKIEEQYRAGKNLSDILATAVPSMDIGSQGRTNFGQNIRGRKILVMIDGVSLNSARGISRQLDSIDPFNIDRIEVLSGATSIYGSGATGGVINIVTKKAQSGDVQGETFISGTSGFNASDDFDYKVAQSISGGTEKLNGRLSAVYGKTQGFYDADGTIVTPDTTQGSLQYNEVIDVLGTVSFKATDTQTFTVLAQYYSSQQDSPYGLYFGQGLTGADPAEPGSVEVREGFETDRNAGTERTMLNATYHHSAFIGHDLYVQASYRTEEYTSTPYFYGSYLSASQQSTDVLSLRAAMVKSLDKLTFTYGVDGYIDQYDANQAMFDQNVSNQSGGLVNQTDGTIGRNPNTEVASMAAFIQAGYQLTDRWSVEAGYRYQYMQNTVDDFVDYKMQRNIYFGNADSADAIEGGETDYSIGLFNLGTIYSLTDNAQVWANFSQGFELPNTAKYYGQGKYSDANGDGHYEVDSATDISSAKLEGVKTNSYELGFRHNDGALDLQTAAYISQSDMIVKYDRTELTLNTENKDERVYGLEGQVSYWFMDRLQAGVSGHYVKSEEKDENGDWKKKSIRYASASKAGAWLGWYDSGYSARLQSQTLFDLDDESEETIDGYTTVDLLGSVDLPVGRLGFAIQNLFNADYSTVWSQRATQWYTGPAEMYDYKGRSRTFTLNYQVAY